MNKPFAFFAAAIAAGSIWCTSAAAGPPLICFPYEIGEARSIPWGGDAFTRSSGYDTSNLVKDTLSVLKTEKSALVRMETIRRAAIYLRDEKSTARAVELLAKASWKAMDIELEGERTGKASHASAAWFDAGFMAATFQQIGIDVGWKPGVGEHVHGYTWVAKALAGAGDDPEMEFGAAVMLADRRSGSYKGHLVRALQGAPPGSPIAKSIASNPALDKKEIEAIRAGSERANAGGGR